MNDKINVEGKEISVSLINDEDYICLTDMAKVREDSEPRFIIRSWMKNPNTVLFLQTWEQLKNPYFNRDLWVTFRLENQKKQLHTFY